MCRVQAPGILLKQSFKPGSKLAIQNRYVNPDENRVHVCDLILSGPCWPGPDCLDPCGLDTIPYQPLQLLARRQGQAQGKKLIRWFHIDDPCCDDPW